MRAMVVREAGGDFALEEREVPRPGFDQALVRVHACGVCHSDHGNSGLMSGRLRSPRIKRCQGLVWGT